MGTKYMWEDVNTKPIQGALFRILQSEMMGVTVEYDDDEDHRRTHPLMLPLIETERVYFTDGNILEKIDVVVPLKKVAKPGSDDRKRSIQVSQHKSISPRAKTSEKQSSVLGEPTYGPGSKTHWKSGSAHYPALYKALLDEPSRTKRIEMVRACTREYI